MVNIIIVIVLFTKLIQLDDVLRIYNIVGVTDNLKM